MHEKFNFYKRLGELFENHQTYKEAVIHYEKAYSFLSDLFENDPDSKLDY